MSFFLNLQTMQGVYVILVLSVCSWEFNLPFAHGFKDIQDEKGIKSVSVKTAFPSAEIKKIKKASTLEAFQKLKEETFPDLGIKPPPGHENDKIIEDSHKYYNSTFILNAKDAAVYWVDLEKMPEEQVISHSMLSDSHRQATTVVLSFDFPFYGSNLRNITIATGGFLYLGTYLHNWIAATQYIAPLMANFDTSISPNSTIKYADNGTTFTVQWDKVSVQDKDGSFTFQVTLIRNGDIVFAYKEIPYSVMNISDTDHPVKIGLSDAYIMERRTFFIRRKTIFEYHRVDFLKQSISNNTAIYFTALPTCLSFHDCESCTTADQILECVWCDSVKRCSDGVDRERQNWLLNGCLFEGQRGECSSLNSSQSTLGIKTLETSFSPKNDVNSTPSFTITQLSSPTPLTSLKTSEEDISLSTSPEPTSKESAIMQGDAKSMESYVQESASVHPVSPGAIVAIIAVLAAVVGMGFWIYYAYKFPQSSSGQFLIKYRPSQWNLKPEEINCNSAAFHM